MLLGLLFNSKRSTRIRAIVKQLKMRPTETGICYDYITAIASRYSVMYINANPELAGYISRQEKCRNYIILLFCFCQIPTLILQLAPLRKKSWT